MADTTDTTTTTDTTSGGWMDTIKTKAEDLLKNEYVKLGLVGVGGFAAGYVVRLVQGWFTKGS